MCIRDSHHANVADGLNPAGRAVRGGIRQLPVADALHNGQNILRREVGKICLRAQWKIGGEKNDGD